MRERFRDKKVETDWLNTNFPCMMACPAQTNAGRYVALIAEGRFEEAYRYARDPNPMASICGLAGLGHHPGIGNYVETPFDKPFHDSRADSLRTSGHDGCLPRNAHGHLPRKGLGTRSNGSEIRVSTYCASRFCDPQAVD